MRLVHKSLIAFCGAAVLPLALAGALVVRQARLSLRETGRAFSLGMARRAAQAVRGHLDGMEAVLGVVRRAPGLATRERAGLAGILEAAMSHYPQLLELRLFAPDGRPLYALERLAGRDDPFAPDWKAVRDAVLESGVYWGGVERAAGGYPRIHCIVPLEPSAGRTAGYLAARVSLHGLNRLLKGQDLGAGTRAFLIDAGSGLIAHSLEAEASGLDLPAPVLAPDWREGEYANGAGEAMLGAKVPVPGLGWFVLVEQPAAAAFHLARQAQGRILGLLLAAGGLALFLCLLTTRRLIGPLNELRGAVRRMKDGDFGGEVAVSSRDELGALAAEIQEARRVLEKRTRDAVLGKMSRLISHDLRMPLSSLRHTLAALRGRLGPLDERGEKLLHLMEEALRSAEEFTEDILLAGRDRELVLRPFDLNVLVRRALEQWPAPEGLDRFPAWGASLPPAHLEEKSASRAFMNVLKNAQEAAAGRVEIRTFTEGGFVRVAVEDDGAGIPEEKRLRLFEEFSTKDGGSGLGLLVVKKIMDQHRGEVRVESPPGRGAAVTLSFPASRAR